MSRGANRRFEALSLLSIVVKRLKSFHALEKILIPQSSRGERGVPARWR
jgi:hypothetical protein